MNRKTVDASRIKHTKELMSKPNVVGVGMGYKVKGDKRTKHLSVVVFVEKKLSKLELKKKDIIPEYVDDVKTDVVETGKFKALQLRTDRWRPAPGGVSIGHKDITAGTLGCLVNRGSEIFILSNNHIFADCNKGKIGDDIYQPGKYDGGTFIDTIATLEKFIPIKFKTGGGGGCFFSKVIVVICNLFAKILRSGVRLKSYRLTPEGNYLNEVDCAIAKPLYEGDVISEILEVGIPTGIKEGKLNMAVKKSGRTTGLTTGVIRYVNATVIVGYGPEGNATFVNQLITGNMSKGGDSGSLLLDTDNKAVGLLFAGSSSQTIHNRIERVLEELDVELVI